VGFRLVDVDLSDRIPSDACEGSEPVVLVLRDRKRVVGLRFVESGVGCDNRQLALDVERDTAAEILRERLRIGLLSRDGRAEDSDRPLSVPGGVTVAVCTRNRPVDLEVCLTAILSARGARSADVLVIDNSPPDDETQRVVERHSGVRYVVEPVAGLDLARNRALAEARNRWIVFVDDDVRVDDGWLDGLAAALREHPDAAAVTGLVLPAELGTDAQVRFERSGGFGRGYRQRRWHGRTDPTNPLHPLGAGVFGAGCNMAFDVSVFLYLGGFDEALDTGPPLPGGGDLDAFFRVLDSGAVLIYEPRMTVFHRHRRTNDELRKQYYSWGLGFGAFLDRRWRDPAQRLQIVRMTAWWTEYAIKAVVDAGRKRDAVGMRCAVAELGGGFVGLAGEYSRSKHRIARRRASFLSQHSMS
jgi:GT2 family glycosyltransferase